MLIRNPQDISNLLGFINPDNRIRKEANLEPVIGCIFSGLFLQFDTIA